MINEPKLKDKDRKEIIRKLKPFWNKYLEKESKFRSEIIEIEKEMTKRLNLEIDLEFFHVDNECVGIGASFFKDRDKFPLIHDSELIKSKRLNIF